MSRKRNRSITNNFEFSSDYLRVLPKLEQIVSNKNGSQSSNRKFYKSTSSSSLSDLDIISCGRNSSSSLSWCDDFDTESTQKVQNEFERMERILQGIEDVPSNYNKDEYELWIKTFPHLSSTGCKITCTKSQQSAPEYKKLDEVIPVHLDTVFGGCVKTPIPNRLLDLNLFKHTLIEQAALGQVSARQKTAHRKNVARLSNQLEGVLRISPVLLGETTSRSYYLDTRQQSSNSIRQSEKHASNWMRNKPSPSDYSSLPYLAQTTTTIKARSSSKLQDNPSFLPPIPNKTRLVTANQFRSISATPRKASNSSAISIQFNTLAPKRTYLEQTNTVLRRRKL